MVRGLRIFLPFPFTRNPVSSHLSIGSEEIEQRIYNEINKSANNKIQLFQVNSSLNALAMRSVVVMINVEQKMISLCAISYD